eukprot:TRINITY_DN3526_c0_g1_i4.p2 TRINITY_DN3526_c0_g1~~TRINITY_DN3526_c0_g1_i4.p2  ORF type:complete len:135 (+),score=27.38 TRINITY_DN3526_c0_g1_i4:195-599(+)
MLARGAQRLSMTCRRGMSTAPRASDRWVNVTFVNQSNGERWPATGLEGQTLLALAQTNKVGLRGGTTRASHVWVTKEFEAAVPTTEEMIAELEEMLDPATVNSGSRLADQIVLTKEMDGMSVAVPLPEGPAEFP